MSDQRRKLYCQEFADLVEACEVDDPLPERLVRIEDHLQTCAACSDAEKALNASLRTLRSSAPEGVSQAFETTLMERFCRTDPDSSSRTD